MQIYSECHSRDIPFLLCSHHSRSYSSAENMYWVPLPCIFLAHIIYTHFNMCFSIMVLEYFKKSYRLKKISRCQGDNILKIPQPTHAVSFMFTSLTQLFPRRGHSIPPSPCISPHSHNTHMCVFRSWYLGIEEIMQIKINLAGARD